MNYEQIEKEFDEKYPQLLRKRLYEELDLTGKITIECSSEVKSFLKQSFIKYLQEQVKEAENKIRFIGGETYCVFCKQHRAAGECNCDGWNEAKIDQITHITNQIKGLEV